MPDRLAQSGRKAKFEYMGEKKVLTDAYNTIELYHLRGALHGEDTIVAAGSLVTENMAVPPRSLVMGSPARVRRALTDDEVRFVLESAGNYVRYRLDYAR